ncbi:hypothetical protein B0H63DRAFT_20602 [Podospora didyma]|uniref:Uncharacterized protein n=1 Tax=Podospora didyma TaxID=330526 RepID=A0AAE0P553_9PEZI|nr:hypothetical protein B0H63DRAFT_20602 [Podospora didyma]
MLAPSTPWLLLLLGTAFAIPAPARTVVAAIAARQDAASAVNPTAAWVTVDESGKPRTITPIQTTISGTPTIISAAPYDVTGTEHTYTNYAILTTSTGAIAAPQATATSGAGSFAVCKNKDGEFKPFCLPVNAANINPGVVKFITWDPSVFGSTNTTVKVIGSYGNNITDQAFSSDNMVAGWGFYQWSVVDTLISTKGGNNVNITLHIAALPVGAALANWYTGPTVQVAYIPGPEARKSPTPTGPALYIALPTVLGFVAIMILGTCYWNRRARRIGLGNIMSRAGRHGYGVGKSRRQRMGGQDKTTKEQAIHLMDRGGASGSESAAATGHVYRDDPLPQQHNAFKTNKNVYYGDDDAEGRPRRDSDALGSLAGSPTEDRHFDDFVRPPPTGNRNNNAFRDELARQDRERI